MNNCRPPHATGGVTGSISNMSIGTLFVISQLFFSSSGLLLPSGFFSVSDFVAESASPPSGFRCAGWFVRLCQMDFRNPSFLWSSSVDASLLLDRVSQTSCPYAV